mgnify:CR=1 FL=1
MRKKRPFDFWIFITVLILLSMGVIMVFSASAPSAYNRFNDIYFFFKSQMKYAILAVIAMIVIMNIDYRLYARWTPLMMIISAILLIMVKIPGIGHQEKGAWRWIYIGPIHFQPSEIFKISLILFLASSLSDKREKLKYFFKGLLPYLLIIGFYALLLLWEPHLSCTMIILTVSSIMLLVAGARVKHFMIIGLPALGALSILVAFVDYMRDRVLSFLDPFKYPTAEGYQAIQSLYAIGSGGLFGRGLGKSLQKFLYLPESHNDFIFSVLAEELGFVGVLAVILLFLIFIWRGVKVSMSAPDAFGSLTAIGITSLIAVQFIFNIAVVTSSMPPTGVSLPFFSAGGTSLILLMSSVGILLNISKYANYERI